MLQEIKRYSCKGEKSGRSVTVIEYQEAPEMVPGSGGKKSHHDATKIFKILDGKVVVGLPDGNFRIDENEEVLLVDDDKKSNN